MAFSRSCGPVYRLAMPLISHPVTRSVVLAWTSPANAPGTATGITSGSPVTALTIGRARYRLRAEPLSPTEAEDVREPRNRYVTASPAVSASFTAVPRVNRAPETSGLSIGDPPMRSTVFGPPKTGGVGPRPEVTSGGSG